MSCLPNHAPLLISNRASILLPRSPSLASKTHCTTSVSTVGKIWTSVDLDAAAACSCALSICSCTAERSRAGVGVRDRCAPSEFGPSDIPNSGWARDCTRGGRIACEGPNARGEFVYGAFPLFPYRVGVSSGEEAYPSLGDRSGELEVE